MKIITLMPVKNEDWILEETLKNISSFSDHIIVADQSSTDKTVEICKKFEKVRVIENNNIGHSNAVRWLLLDEARKIEGENLIFCIDADEMLSPEAAEKIRYTIQKDKLKPGVGFSFLWIQLFESTEYYRIDGVWNNNIKPIAFFDDRTIDYKRMVVINDHTGRIPDVSQIFHIDTYPLLHFQFISKEKSDIKQAWYRCSELIQKPTEFKKINYKYSVSDISSVKTKRTETEWFSGIGTVHISYDKNADWHYREIQNWFATYGIAFFEPLEIWHIPELHNMFVRTTNREPQTKTFSSFLICANRLKNKFIHYLHERSR